MEDPNYNVSSALPGVYKFITVKAKVLEAKNCGSNDTCVELEIPQLCKHKTPTVFGKPNPYFGDVFLFEDLRGINAGLTARLCIAGKSARTICIPRSILQENNNTNGGSERWLGLFNANQKSDLVRCELEICINMQDTVPPRLHFQVLQISSLQRETNAGEVYICAALLPEAEIQKTPLFQYQGGASLASNLYFQCSRLHHQHEIHASIWCLTNGIPEIIGHCSIPLFNLQPGIPMRVTSLMYAYHSVVRGGLLRLARISDPMQAAKAVVQALQKGGTMPAVKRGKFSRKSMHKFINLVAMNPTICSYCGNMVPVSITYSQCSSCKVPCHVRCSRFFSNNCGEVPALKLHISYSEVSLLHHSYYKNFIALLERDNYRLPIYLGKSTSEREIASECLLKLFSKDCSQFLITVLRDEILEAKEMTTLFRSNSIGTKAFDLYMHKVAKDHLVKALKPIIQEIIEFKINLELDPHIEPSDLKRSANMRQLSGLFMKTLQSIWSTADEFPVAIRKVLHVLKETTSLQFLDDPNCRCTSVSAFVFLRFFVPAILGPRLFGLSNEYVDEKVNRSLTLLAKSIQNLANLSQFGEKETLLVALNPVLKSQFENMKNYLEFVSTYPEDATFPITTTSDFEISKASASLCKCFENALGRIVQLPEAKKDLHIVHDLAKMLDQLAETTATGKSKNVDSPSSRESTLSNLSLVQKALPTSKSCVLKPLAFQNDTDYGYGASHIENAVMKHFTLRLTGIFPENFPLSTTMPRTSSVSKPPVALKPSATILRAMGYKKPRIPPLSESSLHLSPEQSPNVSNLDLSAGSRPSSSGSTASKKDALLVMLANAKLGTKEISQICVVNCQICDLAIEDDEVKWDGKSYHKECSACVTCRKILSSSLDAIVMPSKESGIPSFICVECDDMTDAIHCKACNVIINSRCETSYSTESDSYHEQCFVCNVCDSPLKDGYVRVEDFLLCKLDYLRLAGLQCGGCGEIIDGAYVSFGSSKFHLGCKKCFKCQCPLAGEYFTFLSNDYCISHRSEMIKCFNCDGLIEDDEIVYADDNSKFFHVEHFRCNMCNTPLLQDKFHEISNRATCFRCYCNWMSANSDGVKRPANIPGREAAIDE